MQDAENRRRCRCCDEQRAVGSRPFQHLREAAEQDATEQRLLEHTGEQANDQEQGDIRRTGRLYPGLRPCKADRRKPRRKGDGQYTGAHEEGAASVSRYGMPAFQGRRIEQREHHDNGDSGCGRLHDNGAQRAAGHDVQARDGQRTGDDDVRKKMTAA